MNVASIDIGTNTVILLIAEIDYENKVIHPLINEYRMPRIGKELNVNGIIAKPKIKQLINILKEYLLLAEKYGCEYILTAGTNAFRRANNSNEIIDEIYNSNNLKVDIVTKDKEAELSYLGAVFPNMSSERTVIDIGGGSTEIIYGRDSQIIFRKSFPVGVVNLSEKYLRMDPPISDEIFNLIEYISNIFIDELNIIPSEISSIAVAGTPTSLAAIKRNLKEYRENIVDDTILTKCDLQNFITHFSSYKTSDLLDLYPNILNGREDIILSGTLLLYKLCELLKINEVKVSTKGIRYGLLIEKFFK